MQLRDANSPPLQISTDRGGLVLRELSTPTDDQAYFEAVEDSRTELDELEGIGRKYQGIEDVEASRLLTDRRTKIRMGIWSREVLVGSVNATLDEGDGNVEIGYWTRTGYTGQQYASLAARALAAYVAPYATSVFAEAAESNIGSRKVLEHAGFQMSKYRVAHRAGYIAYELATKP